VVSRAVAGVIGNRLVGWDLGLIQQPLVALYAGLEPGELAVGGALGASWHRAARCEQDEGFTGAEGFFVITAPFVEGGEPLVGMAADEAFGDARLVEEDGPLGIAALLRPYGFFVTLHRCLEAAQRVVLRTDPLRLGCLQAEARQLLLMLMVAARDRGIRREADKVLVEATRWLKYHPKDAVIISAREQLRATFPPGS
jgi:hypothetical protein